ncbi:hypothetical protein I0P70_17560 [Pontibacter sp. FD36]|uniref:hypothetical protein n=1 Tax=Pontibacter sp. FD36 TaxID=2789860 RepID=UPI0018AB4DA9|nr:hypothetical protein [Pontibacter sp. FD36]MBF8965059.1 hypothetical protein [Pontibacter sp. FD36]
MKKMLRTWGLLAFVCLWSLTACEEKVSADPAVDLSFTSAEFLLDDLDALSKPHLRDGCDKKQFNIHSVATAQTERHTLAYILPMLHLQANQAGSIRDYAQEHQRTTASPRGSISIIHQEILMKANAERDILLKAYNDNRISFAQLEERLQVLHERVEAELRNHERKQEHMQVLRSQRSALFQNIEAVLDREQLHQWTSWRRSIPS